MSLMITEDCIACDTCVMECMYDAIQEDDPIYVIEPELCTECIEVYSEPACICVCPVDCIVSDKDNSESVAELKLKKSKLESDEG